MISREAVSIFLKGTLMGIGNMVPGISGGTIALITGIYERLVHSISSIDLKFITYFLKGDLTEATKNVKNIDFNLFIPLLLGIGSAVLLITNIIYFLLQYFTAITCAFFFGLILASAFLIYMKESNLSVKNIVASIIGFVSAFLFAGMATVQFGHSLFIIFLSGIVATCAMILPGISGAFILLLLGQYEYILSVLRNLQLLEIFIFCAGGLIGILSFSKFLNYIMNKYRSITIYFLIGVMLGALRLPYQKIAGNVDVYVDAIIPVLITAMLGFFIVLYLDWHSKRWGKEARD